jgi:capsular exopolysaccharide synthesis family protein
LASPKKQLSIIDFYDLESPESTEFRRILKMIENTRDPEKKSILITSAMLSEGKSLLTAFLAITAAKSRRKKTLLIDFDLRRPMVHKLFRIPLENGVTDVLFSSLTARVVVKKTDIDQLDLITAGEIIKNPSELFNGPAIHNIFEELKFYYDLILIDSPPIIPVVDPLILLEELDGAVLVIKAGATNRDVVKRARNLLSAHKDKIIGVVVNNIGQTLPYYYNYNYYGYHYKAGIPGKKPKTVEPPAKPPVTPRKRKKSPGPPRSAGQ